MESGRKSQIYPASSWTLTPQNAMCRLSKKHKDKPWGMHVHGQRYEVNYWPGDSHSGMFGGNSNWRGPICMSLNGLVPHFRLITRCLGLAVNFLLIESLQRFYQYYGDEVEVRFRKFHNIMWTHNLNRSSAQLAAVIT